MKTIGNRKVGYVKIDKTHCGIELELTDKDFLNFICVETPLGIRHYAMDVEPNGDIRSREIGKKS